MPEKILITGGTGFIGSHLQKQLRMVGYEVAILSGRKSSKPDVFYWNVKKGEIDPEAFDGTSTIIHLAGAGIADKRWTAKRKTEIISSRTQGIELLFNKLQSIDHDVKTFISSSATGIYGNTGNAWADESSPHGNDFLAVTCTEWELSAHKMDLAELRVVIFRTGVVLGKDGGALPVISKPIKFFAGAPLGNGQQYMSWIHIDDLCRLIIQAIKKETMHGVYNAVASNPVTNKEFTKTLARILHRPVWPSPVPGFMLKLILGEKASIVLDGQRVSNKKIISEGFLFRFSELKAALEDIYKD